MSVPPAVRAGQSSRTWWVVGVLGVLAMTAVAVWFGIAATSGRVHWVNTGFRVVADREVEVRFDVVRDPGRAVLCRLEALDDRRTRVGVTEVTVPPTERSPSRHTATVGTVSRATTGYVDGCVYAER